MHHLPVSRFFLILSAALLGLTMAPGLSEAGSPWVLPEGDTVFQFDFRTESADREFLPDGTNQRFPLNGRYSGQALTLSLRQGLGANLEVSVEASWVSVAYISDPVTILSEAGGTQIVPTFSLSSQTAGLGDVVLSTRYNVYKGPVLITPELRVKIPTGYAPPSGTFENDDPGLLSDGDGGFNENTQGIVPVADDVTLGSGQVDIRASVLFGAFVSKTRTFARVAGGFNLRLGGPGHQVMYDAKVGQFLSDLFIIFVGLDGARTVTDGEIIGKSFTTNSPSTPAAGFPLADLVFTDIRVDQDYLKVLGGIIFKPGKYEVILTGGRILDGENVTELVFTSLATSYKF